MVGASLTPRALRWAEAVGATVAGSEVVVAHGGKAPPPLRAIGAMRMTEVVDRRAREDVEDSALADGATRAVGAGDRARPEAPDELRTCFERDRDRILHASAFRRLAGKTQVFVYPADHQRTRLTHALEVAQVATAVSRAVGLNVALTEAAALGHDCGHGPGGHASEDAFNPLVPGGYEHSVWGADVVLAPLNLCAQTLDAIRNHSWSRPTPATPEGVVVSWADRCAYSAHDLEDAISAGVVNPADLPTEVVELAGTTRTMQLRYFVGALVHTIVEHGTVGMASEPAAALSALRAFNYERIYTRDESLAQASAVVAVLRALVGWYCEDPTRVPQPWANHDDPARAAVTYVGGMTDRFAFDTAVDRLGWRPDRLPRTS